MQTWWIGIISRFLPFWLHFISSFIFLSSTHFMSRQSGIISFVPYHIFLVFSLQAIYWLRCQFFQGVPLTVYSYKSRLHFMLFLESYSMKYFDVYRDSVKRYQKHQEMAKLTYYTRPEIILLLVIIG